MKSEHFLSTPVAEAASESHLIPVLSITTPFYGIGTGTCSYFFACYLCVHLIPLLCDDDDVVCVFEVQVRLLLSFTARLRRSFICKKRASVRILSALVPLPLQWLYTHLLHAMHNNTLMSVYNHPYLLPAYLLFE